MAWLYFDRGVECRDYPSEADLELYGIVEENNVLRQDVTNLLMRGVLKGTPPSETAAGIGTDLFILNAPSPVTVSH